MSARTYTAILNRLDEAETEVGVEYTWTPGAPDTYDAARGGPGGWDPGWSAEVEIVRVEMLVEGYPTGATITATDAEEAAWTRIILDNHDRWQRERAA